MYTETRRCKFVFVARCISTSEFLYFFNQDNQFDVVFTPDGKDGVISIASLQEAKRFQKIDQGRMGSSLLTLGDKLVACEPKYNKGYVRILSIKTGPH